MIDQTDRKETIDFYLAQVCKLHHARAHTLLESKGVHRGQPPLLFLLWEKEGWTHGELAEKLHVKPATISNMVKRMEHSGLVERRSDPADERVSRVFLTEQGRSIQEEVEKALDILEEEQLVGFSDEEKSILLGFLKRIRENLLKTYRVENLL